MATLIQMLKDPAQSNQIVIRLGEGGYTTYDPMAAKAAREADAQWAHRYEELLAEDRIHPTSWFARVGQVMRRAGASRAGRAMFGWVDSALFVVAIHVVPTLWLLDELRQKDHASSMAMFHVTMRNLYAGPWYAGHRMVNPSGYFHRHPLAALAAGVVAFLLTSPMLIATVPLVAVSRLHDRFATWMGHRRVRRGRVV